ncbi:hypothetical protein DFH11DRAFT_1506382 [Phellopilus nigrolimitatus]|nr:hypothetical protein DFH11DRAFT_1506382 [Phellopilus nigrolimitatus]
MDTGTAADVEHVEQAIDELQAALQKLSVSGAVTQRNLLTVEDLLDVAAENITEEEWTDDEIVDQVRINAVEASGGVVEGLDDSEHDAPLMSLSAACQAITELERLCHRRSEPVFKQARGHLHQLRMKLRAEHTENLVQPNITQFFSS